MLRKALAELPKTLDETYDRILNSIPEEYRGDAYRVFQLLCVSFRPLTLGEIAETLAIDSENELFLVENRLRDKFDTLEICSSLVSLYRCIFKSMTQVDD